MTRRARGRFITLEGGEGVGKSTQARRLAARLRTRGLEVVETREPGGTPRAEALRKAILEGAARDLGPAGEATLFYAARADLLDTLIRPALARGAWVVCDRFADSTEAYQGARGGADPGLLMALRAAIVGTSMPDLTLVFDLDPARGLARARSRSGAVDRFEGEGFAFHRDLRAAFLAIAEREPKRCRLIDAAADEDAVETAIWNAVAAKFRFARAAAKSVRA
ncbi:MAG: dTMP kinase [Hyphomicrobiales bacterium]|nr:dTMP kinase [Hyphomicrobiales bacterium]